MGVGGTLLAAEKQQLRKVQSDYVHLREKGLEEWIVRTEVDGLPEYKPSSLLGKLASSMLIFCREKRQPKESNKDLLRRIFGSPGYSDRRYDSLQFYEKDGMIVARGDKLDLYFEVTDFGTEEDEVTLFHAQYYHSILSDYKEKLPIKKKLLTYKEARKKSRSFPKSSERLPDIVRYIK